MKISRIGGVIAAASIKDAEPLLQIGTIPIIKRIVISFQQAGIFPIVVVTGAEEAEVKYQLSSYGVIFIRNENCEQPELIDSVKIGLKYLLGKCDRMVFTPVNVPMFTPATLNSLIAANGDIITPSCNGKGGHPIILSESVVPEIIAYSGIGGLKAAISSMPDRRIFLPVDDPGIFISVRDCRQLEDYLAEHNRALLHPTVQLNLQKESVFFNTRIKLLLYLILDTHSVRSACDRMALSYGKAWDMLNKLEEETGYPIAERKHGGKRGGNTTLTPQGIQFLKTWQKLEDSIFQFTQKEFSSLFRDNGLFR
jgi:molybdate transport repressor ModE-like protein